MRAAAMAAVLAAALGVSACGGAFGSDPGDKGAVYTMTNSAGANHVLVFARADDGHLTFQDSVATGGAGSGPDPVFFSDPLGSQDALVLGDDHHFLFVVNAGSNDISSFRVAESGALTLVNRVASRGVFPVSLAVRGNLLYVVNAGGGGNLAGYRIAADGTLSPIDNTVRPLSGAAQTGPGSIRISPDLHTLVVTEKPTNLLDIYALSSAGVPGESQVAIASGPTPFGADFDPSGHYLVSLANVGPNRTAVTDGSAVGSIVFTGFTTPAVVSGAVPTTETAACWVQITSEGAFAYTSNTASGTITGFRISSRGGLTRLTPDGRTGVTGPNTEPLEMAYSNGFLYALTAGDRGVHVFKVSGDGSLKPMADADRTGIFPISVTGLAAF